MPFLAQTKYWHYLYCCNILRAESWDGSYVLSTSPFTGTWTGYSRRERLWGYATWARRRSPIPAYPASTNIFGGWGGWRGVWGGVGGGMTPCSTLLETQACPWTCCKQALSQVWFDSESNTIDELSLLRTRVFLGSSPGGPAPSERQSPPVTLQLTATEPANNGDTML